MIYFVSRHPGAVEWARRRGLDVDRLETHFDPAMVRQGDTVIGTLPVHLVADVCEHGGRYLHLSIDLPLEWRGRELSVEDMESCNARLEEYRVQRVPIDQSAE